MLYEGQRNLDKIYYKSRCKEADLRRKYFYEKQNKRSTEALQTEVDKFMIYYETQSGFGLPISIVVAQQILKERQCKNTI